MALKKISRKKLREVISETYDEIKVGNSSHILGTLDKFKIDLHTIDIDGCTFLWGIGTGLNKNYPPKHNSNVIACMQFLIDNGADVNHRVEGGETVLHLVSSVDRSNPEAVEMLIRNGADVNCVDDNGNSPLVMAIMSFEDGYPEVITPLLKAGADPYLKLDRKKKLCDNPVGMVKMWSGTKNNSQLRPTFFKVMKELGLLEE